MNFEDVRFWVLLFTFGGVALATRALIVRVAPNKASAYDVIALALVSLSLFYLAAGRSFWVFLGELAFTYLMLTVIARSSSEVVRWTAVIAGVALPLAVLIFYKYWNFLLAGATGMRVEHQSSLIPPGVAFYTFEMVATVVDAFRTAQAQPRFIDYLNYASFFPQLVAGPIERRPDLLPQVQRFRFTLSWAKLYAGLPLIVLGLFYKLVLADNIAPLIRTDPTQNAYVIWDATYLFGLRIYFDFAGYSLIAVGLGKSLGVQLHHNFLAPYSARNIRDFWRRWHITLGRWFRDYVYLPLGGSRSGLLLFNLLATFALSGLWHGAGFNFLLWGVVHGCLMLAYVGYVKWKPRRDPPTSPTAYLSWALTCLLVTFSWLFFYETETSVLFEKLQTLFSISGYTWPRLVDAFSRYLNQPLGALPVLSMSLTVLLLENRGRIHENPYFSLTNPRITCLLFALVVLFSPGVESPFIYFRF